MYALIAMVEKDRKTLDQSGTFDGSIKSFQLHVLLLKLYALNLDINALILIFDDREEIRSQKEFYFSSHLKIFQGVLQESILGRLSS